MHKNEFPISLKSEGTKKIIFKFWVRMDSGGRIVNIQQMQRIKRGNSELFKHQFHIVIEAFPNCLIMYSAAQRIKPGITHSC